MGGEEALGTEGWRKDAAVGRIPIRFEVPPERHHRQLHSPKPARILTTMYAAIIIVLVMIAVGVVGGVLVYNALVSRQLEAENAWAHIDVQLKRRYELIPNLVEVVRGYAGHEKETLEKVIQARNFATGQSGRADLAQADNALVGPLRNLFMLAEAYPQIKANQHFQHLHEELNGTESRISFARQYYNDTVARYNTLLNRFPSNMLAGLLGFQRAEFFRLAAKEATVPGAK